MGANRGLANSAERRNGRADLINVSEQTIVGRLVQPPGGPSWIYPTREPRVLQIRTHPFNIHEPD